jgi:tryptophanyl-tRNA synthetase
MKTKEEIKKKIKEIAKDSDNFTNDNYGSEAADNGIYEIYYSEILTENTLTEFVNWIFD